MNILIVVLVALFLSPLGGCSSCEQPEQPPAAAPEAPAAGPEGAPPAPAAEQAPAAQAPEEAEEIDPDADCFVILDADPDYGPAPLKVQFSADVDCASGEPKYLWNFGDGSPTSAEKSPVHTYTKVGEYPASITVTGPSGGTDSDELDILVEAE
jgi:hypothetical protein